MKRMAIVLLLAAFSAAGCGEKEPQQAETPKERSAKEVAAEAERILAAAPKKDASGSVSSPGFFGGGPSRGSRTDLVEDSDRDPYPSLRGNTGKSASDPEPVKKAPPRPAPRIFTPDEQAAKQFKLARLYLTNADNAPSAVRKRFLQGQAVAILEKMIAKHPKAPSTAQAKQLLTSLQDAQ